jgi:hypothetical protein
VGYGDITAKSQGARIMVMFQMFADLILLGLGAKAILRAVQLGRQRQPGPPGSDTAASSETSSAGP